MSEVKVPSVVHLLDSFPPHVSSDSSTEMSYTGRLVMCFITERHNLISSQINL